MIHLNHRPFFLLPTPRSGARPWSTQLLIESLILSAAGGGIGALLATWLIRGLTKIDPTELPHVAAITIDVTKSLHVIAGVNGTSATSTYTPSAAGSAGDILEIITSADGSGTVTVTFASTFRSAGTQATTLNKISSIRFVSNGTNWIETSRVTALT